LDGDTRPGGRGRSRRGPVAYRSDIVDRLHPEGPLPAGPFLFSPAGPPPAVGGGRGGGGLLPAILFIFSRAGADAAVQQCMQAGLRLTTPDERAEIRAIVETRVADMPGQDLNV